jgi:hypothetical protein
MDSLRYAFTEAGEAMDAWLREQRPNDARNNERQPDVLDELADAAIMLVTAVPNYSHNVMWGTRSHDIDGICTEIASATVIGAYHPQAAVGFIAAYPGMDLEARVIGRLRAIYAKRWPVKNDDRWNQFLAEVGHGQ